MKQERVTGEGRAEAWRGEISVSNTTKDCQSKPSLHLCRHVMAAITIKSWASRRHTCCPVWWRCCCHALCPVNLPHSSVWAQLSNSRPLSTGFIRTDPTLTLPQPFHPIPPHTPPPTNPKSHTFASTCSLPQDFSRVQPASSPSGSDIGTPGVLTIPYLSIFLLINNLTNSFSIEFRSQEKF